MLATEFSDCYGGRKYIFDQFHPNWKPETVLPPSPGSLVPVATALAARFVAAAGRWARTRFA